MKRTMLLILPALQEVLSSEFRQIKYALFPPLSLLTLAALTPEDRYRVIVRDEHVESTEVDEHVDLVAMTVYISSAHRAYELADGWRARGARVILGGIHPSMLPEEAAPHADSVCIGPAEPVWAEILADFERGHLKKFYRANAVGSAARTPLPRRDLINQKAYLVRNTMVASRGCPHHCDFCYKSAFWGRTFYEQRTVHDIEREIESLEGGFVFFLDDNFFGCPRHVRQMLPLLSNAGMVWQAAASLDVSPKLLHEAYEAGCRSLFVGFESLSPDSMLSAGKVVNARTDYATKIRMFHDAGIMINGSFAYGFDNDRADVFDRTLEFAIENKIETATFHILTPYPGTALYERMERAGRLLHRDWRHYDTRHTVFRPAQMTPDELEAGYWRSYDEFYRYGSILRRSMGLPNPIKRMLYNIGWRKLDRIWSAIISLGLLPVVRPIFELVLAGTTRNSGSRAALPDGAVCAGRVPTGIREQRNTAAGRTR